MCVRFGSSPVIKGNTITDNTAENGGGIAVDASPSIEGNTFQDNRAIQGGGAIWVSGSSELVVSDPDDNTYSGNRPDDISGE